MHSNSITDIATMVLGEEAEEAILGAWGAAIMPWIKLGEHINIHG